MNPDPNSLLAVLDQYGPLIELTLFLAILGWIGVASRASQSMSLRKLEAEIAGKEAELNAVRGRLEDKDQSLDLMREDAEIRLSAKQSEVEKFQSILDSKEQEIRNLRERLEIESGMYKDIIAAKDEKFALQHMMLKSLEERYAQETQLFRQRYDELVHQRSEAIGKLEQQ